MKLRATILCVVFLLSAASALGQGCSMCYSSVHAASRNGQRAIHTGVILLLVPSVGFMTLGVWTAFRYGMKRDAEQLQEHPL